MRKKSSVAKDNIQTILHLPEKKVPRIGIFWLLETGRLLVNVIPYDQSSLISGSYAIYSDHYHYWESKIRPELDQEYTDNPRGRVVYNIKTKTAKIMASHDILRNRKIVKQIAKEFTLRKYFTRADEHYGAANHLL
ncbi:hypothetical protein RDn1_112 [Candidatus Termititenax dinenymphae]|uniref:Uncharacterized protein n=1 Tax=Candidatus Termititenax dinenymphae TaxID=2218523 RepID=A0A388TJH8_9BACT|nr:hypothetical protein RDn1_112 [Candidatus Termititenax dinenymphae]